MSQSQLQLFLRFYQLFNLFSAYGYPQGDVSSNRVWELALPRFFTITEVLRVREEDITNEKVNRNDGEERDEIFGLKDNGIDYPWTIEGDFENMHS